MFQVLLMTFGSPYQSRGYWNDCGIWFVACYFIFWIISEVTAKFLWNLSCNNDRLSSRVRSIIIYPKKNKKQKKKGVRSIRFQKSRKKEKNKIKNWNAMHGLLKLRCYHGTTLPCVWAYRIVCTFTHKKRKRFFSP